MREVLFTSFGPFRDIVHNPSILVASVAAAAVCRAGGKATALELPVTYAAVASAAVMLGREPLRLHLGVAASRTLVTVEQWGKPESGEEADNDGEVGPDVGPDAVALRSSSAERLQAALREEGVDVALSEDAGGFVCNAMLWHSLQAGADACFVHVPALTDEAAELLGLKLGRAVIRLLGGGSVG